MFALTPARRKQLLFGVVMLLGLGIIFAFADAHDWKQGSARIVMLGWVALVCLVEHLVSRWLKDPAANAETPDK